MQQSKFSLSDTDNTKGATAPPASGGIINPWRWLLAAVLGNQFTRQGIEH